MKALYHQETNKCIEQKVYVHTNSFETTDDNYFNKCILKINKDHDNNNNVFKLLHILMQCMLEEIKTIK